MVAFVRLSRVDEIHPRLVESGGGVVRGRCAENAECQEDDE